MRSDLSPQAGRGEEAPDRQPHRRPGARRDPYRVISRCGAVAETFHHHEGRWLWVPACAGTTWGGSLRASSPSPSLPRRDDLNLVAGLDRCRGPGAEWHHVVIDRGREMRAFVVEFAQQRVDA